MTTRNIVKQGDGRRVIVLNHLPDPELNPNKRLHWSKIAEAKRVAKEEAMALVYQQGKPTEPYAKAHITITWISKNKRRRDVDNLFASMKPYIDGLVASGLLVDDSADVVSYALEYRLGDENSTRIDVEQKDRPSY